MTRDGWHECALCGAAYRSRAAALQCCGDRLDDDRDGDDPTPSRTGWPVAFEFCGLCGDSLSGARDVETGVCTDCVATDGGAPAPLRTEGDNPNYAVVLNGHPCRGVDAGGSSTGWVECEGPLAGERVRVFVTVTDAGVRGVEVLRDEDDRLALDRAADQPDQGAAYVASDDVDVRVELLPAPTVATSGGEPA